MFKIKEIKGLEFDKSTSEYVIYVSIEPNDKDWYLNELQQNMILKQPRITTDYKELEWPLNYELRCTIDENRCLTNASLSFTYYKWSICTEYTRKAIKTVLVELKDEDFEEVCKILNQYCDFTEAAKEEKISDMVSNVLNKINNTHVILTSISKNDIYTDIKYTIKEEFKRILPLHYVRFIDFRNPRDRKEPISNIELMIKTIDDIGIRMSMNISLNRIGEFRDAKYTLKEIETDLSVLEDMTLAQYETNHRKERNAEDKHKVKQRKRYIIPEI